MALVKARLRDVPEDAVIISEHDALVYQANIIKKWENPIQSFPVKYGSYSLGIASLGSGIYFNNHIRRKLKLLHYGRMSSYLPVCFLPAAVSALCHFELVTKDVLLLKDKCPVCIELRAASLQAFLGCVFPFVLAPIGAIALSHQYNTYDVPYVREKPMELLRFIQNKLKPIKGTTLGLFLVHAVLGSLMTYAEAKSVLKINEEIAKEEEKYLNR